MKTIDHSACLDSALVEKFAFTFSSHFVLAAILLIAASIAVPIAWAQSVASGNIKMVSIINTVAGNGASGYSGDGGAATSAELSYPLGVVLDSAGNLYIADTFNNRIRKVTASTGDISTVAGNGTAGYSGDGGPATSAELDFPFGVVVDSAGNLYIADTYNQRIRKVTATTGVITTVAGNGYGAPNSCGFSGDGGPATSAELCGTNGVAVDSAGNLYIADTYNNRIRKVTASTGIISTVAGNGTYGYSGDGGPATSAELWAPQGVAVDSAGNLYIADRFNQRIRKVTASTGIITTVAGNGASGYSGDGGPATSAKLAQPFGVAVDSAGNLYIADSYNNRIRKVSAITGVITTVAGNGTYGYAGDNGPATSAELSYPQGVVLDSLGNLYIPDSYNQRIRKVSTNAILPTTPVGMTSASQSVYLQLPAASAISSITVPKTQNGAQEFAVGTVSGCSVGGASNVAGTVCTVPVTFSPAYPGVRTGALTVNNGGSVVGTAGLSGTGQAPEVFQMPGALTVWAGGGSGVPTTTGQWRTGVALNSPEGVAVDGAGNLYIADDISGLVEKVDAATGMIAAMAGGGTTVPTTTPAAATGALIDPFGIAVDGAGNLYIADTGNSLIEKVDGTTGAIVLVAGGGSTTPSTTPEAATSALLNHPQSVMVDATGNLYIADTGESLLEKVTPSGQIVLVAGGGSTVPTTTPEPVTNASIDPSGLAMDGAGNLYVADSGNGLVEKIDLTTGQIVLLAGGGSTFPSATPEPATSARLNIPRSVQVDAAGNLYIADSISSVIYKVDAATGEIVVVAGGGTTVPTPADLVAITATSAQLNMPSGVTVDGAGNLYVADSKNSLVEKVGTDVLALDFPNTNVGATSAAQGVTLANIGNQPLQLSNLTNATDYPLENASSCTVTASTAQTLAPGSSCDLVYAFQPTTNGVLNEIATLTDNTLNGANAQQTIPLVGTATSTTPNATTTALMASTTNTPYGVSVTFTATVTTGGSPATTGTVTFTSGTTSLGTGTVNSSGVAVLNTTQLPVGTDSVTATYGANGNYAASSATTTVTITGQSTATVVTAAPASVAYGSSVTLTALVTGGGNPVITGSVTFYSGSTSLGTETLNASGKATLMTSSLPVGTDSITASYAAQGNYAASTSTATSVIVTGATLTLTANNATRVYGAANPVFTGTVTGAVNGDSFTEMFSTTATTTSPVASYAIVPAVSGANLADYTTTIVNGTLKITQAGTTTALALSTASSGPSQSVTLTATVTSSTSSGTPTGTVIFYNGTTSLGTGTLANGVASFITTSLGVGTDSLTAQYGGDTNFTGSTSPAVIETVSSPGVTATPSALSLTVAPGGSATDALTITPVGGYSGSLQFSCNGLPQAATCSFQPATVTVTGTGSPVNVTVTIQTAGSSTAAEIRPLLPTMPGNLPVIPAAVFWMPGWVMAAIAGSKRKLSSRGRHLLMLMFLLAGMGILTACGSGNHSMSTPPSPTTPVTPAGTSTVQVLVTGSGGLSQSINLTLTVQ
ncbi:MAG: NHL domain-containing protein [Sulfobacillus sp.]